MSYFLVEAFRKRVQYYINKETDCWEIISHKPGPYGYVQLTIKGFLYQAHRLSFLSHYGYIEEDKQICHKCDNPICVNPDHLFLGTQDDNMSDMMKKGRNVVTRKQKLTDEDRDDIRNSSESALKLSEKYPVTARYIRHLQNKNGRKLIMTKEQVFKILESSKSSCQLSKETGISSSYIRRLRAGERLLDWFNEFHRKTRGTA